VRGDQLLLLVQGVEEAERVRPEPDDGHDGQKQERAAGARRHSCALAPDRRRQHHEREHQPGGGLDAHAGREHGRRRAQMGNPRRLTRPPRCARSGKIRSPTRSRDTGREREGARQHQQHERVVVGAAHRELQQHRVQAHEHRRRLC
jgi:hypothetical protein